MERHIFPKNGRPVFGNIHNNRCIIISNKSHSSSDLYIDFCKLEFLELQWTSMIVDPSPKNVEDPDVLVVFCVDLGWDDRMLQLRDIFIKKGKFINICRFGDDWENFDLPQQELDTSLGESLLISEFQHFVLKD
jgi:hypothetical protein